MCDDTCPPETPQLTHREVVLCVSTVAVKVLGLGGLGIMLLIFIFPIMKISVI